MQLEDFTIPGLLARISSEETYDKDDNDDNNPAFHVNDDYKEDRKAAVGFLEGWGIAMLIFVIINLGLFIWSIVLMARHTKDLPEWAVVLGWVLVFIFPLGSIIIVFVVPKKTGSRATLRS